MAAPGQGLCSVGLVLAAVQDEEEQAGRSPGNFKLPFLVVPGIRN